ncbi:MAG: glucose-6-phosphate dehydrogenase assembly protein OpcA [Micromonosporaceae bacterium]
MTIDLTDTTTGRVQAALTEARRRLGGPAMGMVLTLVIGTNEAMQYDAIRAASHAGREHPSRVLGVITRNSRSEPRLDAEIRVGENAPGETVLLRLYGALGEHADSVVAPLLVPDTPVVTWWPGQAPDVPAADPLGALAQRRITDAASSPEPTRALASLAAAYQPGDTDFSWTRATPWRSLLAAVLDQPYEKVIQGLIAAEDDNPSAALLAAWLSAKLGAPFTREHSPGPGITEVRFSTMGGDIAITRPDGRVATLSRAGVPDRTVALHRRDTAELLAEELRRLDPDEVYAESVAFFAPAGGSGGVVPPGHTPAGGPGGVVPPGQQGRNGR